MAPHAHLGQVLQRHFDHAWRRPLAEHSLAAWAPLRDWLAQDPQWPLWLDSGCGTGASSHAFASACPQVRVLGVDQSRARLQRGGLGEDDFRAFDARLALVRMPLEDLWRLLAAAGIRLARHLLLYPNPWPKARQLRLRWHAHPAFPTLLALGGEIELRSNWRVYIDEFAQALEWRGWRAHIEDVTASVPPTSPFERKYRDSGHQLWRLLANFPGEDTACAS